MRYLIIFLLLISSAEAQIPAGVFNQGSRDLSKEIWISFSVGQAQPPGFYINTFDPESGIVYLKNAKGESTLYQVYADFEGYGFVLVDNPIGFGGYTGQLPIINSKTLGFIQDDENYMSLNIFYSNFSDTSIADIYALSNAPYFGAGYIIADVNFRESFGTPKPLITPAPILEELDIDDSFSYLGKYNFGLPLELNANTMSIWPVYNQPAIQFRAIVIKLL